MVDWPSTNKKILKIAKLSILIKIKTSTQMANKKIVKTSTPYFLTLKDQESIINYSPSQIGENQCNGLLSRANFDEKDHFECQIVDPELSKVSSDSD
jgi:hypothetical protein